MSFFSIIIFIAQDTMLKKIEKDRFILYPYISSFHFHYISCFHLLIYYTPTIFISTVACHSMLVFSLPVT